MTGLVFRKSVNVCSCSKKRGKQKLPQWKKMTLKSVSVTQDRLSEKEEVAISPPNNKEGHMLIQIKMNKKNC